MKNKYFVFLISILIAGFFLTSCGGAGFIPSGWPGLIADKETAYLATGPNIHAIDLKSGTEKWRYPEKVDPKHTYYTPPAYTWGGQLVIGSYGNKIMSFNPVSRSENWSNMAGNRFIGGVLIKNNMIYAPNADSHLYAYDMGGNLLWQKKTNGPIWATPVSDGANKIIFVTSMDHRLYAFEAITGTPLWNKDLGNAITGTPAIGEDGILYVATFGSEMFAIDTTTQEIKWRVAIKGWGWAGPAVKGDILYFGDYSGNFYAMRTADGSILWNMQPDGPILSTPLVTENAVYFTTEAGTLYAVDHSGTILWNATNQCKIYSSPVLAEDLILVAPTECEFYLLAYNQNGAQQWSFKPSK